MEYEKLVNEIMAVEGAVSCALLENVVDVLVICSGATPKVVTKGEIAEQLASAGKN